MMGIGIPSATRHGGAMADGEDIPPPKPDFSAPPPYEVATKLPTYEEVQREKNLQGEQTHMPLTFLAIDTEAPDGDNETGLLGTDFMFFTAFLVAFLFNWIGFLLLMCFCHTIAARYGALSGFGLSLAKWTLIVKHSTDLASRENSWLWWLIMAFGLLICVRAIIQYLNIKRGWRLLSGSAQERLLFFY
ncbi:NEDD4 family-interacting protein 1-like isoform X2 [Anabrus simplex]